MAISCFFSMNLKAQTIQIDSTFNTDGEIFPFGTNDTIYGLSISGHVSLLTDTSLVRVILTDNSGNEWMVYEAYPFISSRREFEISEVSDETMFRMIINPNSLKIQIINASLDLDSGILQNRYRDNLEILQETFKNTIESNKVDSINHVIEVNHMLWFANITAVSGLSHFEKAARFGEKYNLLGLDYYTGGIYDGKPGVDGPADESELVDSFDWRNRHGANDPLKGDYYYNEESTGNGWITSVKDQNPYSCRGTCYIYGPLAAIEGVANLYFNQHIDYDLSEQHVLDCDDDVSIDECEGGSVDPTFAFARDYGIFDDYCYPRDETHGTCRQDQLPNGPPQYRVKISGTDSPDYSNDYEGIKDSLINFGPLVTSIRNYYGAGHFIALVGYGTIKAGDKFWSMDSANAFTVPPNSKYIGQLFWIFKNSWGTGVGEGGYFNHLSEDIYFERIAHIKLPIDDILHTTDTINAYDKDQDGYWNWGISKNYTLPAGVCSDKEDSDDSENRIGPFDSHYKGTNVKPEMEVTVGLWNSTPITNHGFYFFDENNVTLTFQIKNPGSANLHLIDETPGSVSITGPDASHFANIMQPDKTEICFDGNGTSVFSMQFSTEETQRMHEAHVKISIKPIDKDVLEDFEFGLIFNGCNLTGQDHHVTGYESYNDYDLIPNDIYIESGGVMVVFGSLAMYPESDIVVKAGGRLIVNGGLITGSCKELWHGIDVWGSESQPQTLEFQGMVSVINGGCIEYAETAIETVICPSCERPFPTGGIVSCSDAIFKDNIIDVHLYPYTNRNPVNQQILPNYSRFFMSIFKTTDDLFTISRNFPSTHLFLDDVGGLIIKGCSFGNYSKRINGSRGKGIESYSAGYFVSPACAMGNIIPCPEQIPCRFENLEYGIRAFGYMHFSPDYNADYTKDGSCPSHLDGGINLLTEKSILSNETNVAEDYLDTLLMKIDGGNTAGLNYNILTSFPEEALVLRQELIAESPYLSDTVMISAIEKEEVLPGAMVRDILVQNPQAPKSEKVLDALNERLDTIPDYMMEEIMQGLNVNGAKELLEQKLGGHIAKRDRAWNNLNLYFKNDTANMGASFDSLISLYEDENRLVEKYRLAFMYINKDDSLRLRQILNNIPSEFILSDKELTTHNHYEDLFSILWKIKTDATGHDSLQVELLSDLANDNRSIPGCYAYNILIKERDLIYNEPVYLCDPLKSVTCTPTKDRPVILSERLKVFPNPADNYFIAEYDLTGIEGPGKLSITDVSGKSLESFQLKDKQNQIVIPSKYYSPGSYLVNLIVGNNLVGSIKLIISK